MKAQGRFFLGGGIKKDQRVHVFRREISVKKRKIFQGGVKIFRGKKHKNCSYICLFFNIICLYNMFYIINMFFQYINLFFNM